MRKVPKDKKGKKLSDHEFWSILRKNAGLYARTARAIEKEFGCSYTRQSVQERAEKKPELLKDIREQNIDFAEEGLQDLMRSKKEKIKLESVKFYLKTQGKKRGYIETKLVGEDEEHKFTSLANILKDLGQANYTTSNTEDTK